MRFEVPPPRGFLRCEWLEFKIQDLTPPVGVMRVASPDFGLVRVPAATRSTTRLPEKN